MKLVSKVAGISVLAIAGSVVALVPANAAVKPIIVGQAQITADAGSNKLDHTELTRDGLVMAVDAGGKNMQYFDYQGDASLAALDSIDYAWVGTTDSLSISVVIDKDGDPKIDGDWDGSLVFQHGSNGKNLWATNSRVQNNPLAPKESGGANSANGSLAQWQAALPDATIKYIGVNLGSAQTPGATLAGVLKSVTFNDDVYKFTSEAAPVATNEAPTARFAAAKKNLAVEFDGSFSSDHDGTVVDYAWNFGDTKSSSAAKPTHVYAKAGTYQVTLTVTDNTGATGSATKPVTVTAASAPVVKIKQDVTGFSSVKKVGARKLRVELVSNPLKTDTVEGKRLGWTIKVDGRTRFSTQQHADDRDIWTRKFPKHAGRHKVEIFKNGHLVRTIKVNIKA